MRAGGGWGGGACRRARAPRAGGGDGGGWGGGAGPHRPEKFILSPGSEGWRWGEVQEGPGSGSEGRCEIEWNMDPPPYGKWTPLHSYPNFAAYYPNFVAYYVHCLSKLETL